MGNTYIKIHFIDENDNINDLGMKINMKVRLDVKALDVANKLLMDSLLIVDAEFITPEEYERDYGDDE